MEQLRDQAIAAVNPAPSKRPLSKAEFKEMFYQISDPYIINQGHDENPSAGGIEMILK